VPHLKAHEEKGMKNKVEIAQLQKQLEIHRQEAIRLLRQLERETRSLDVDEAQDPADQCVTSISKESLFEQSSQRRTSLRLIEAALRRIDNGTFGECAGCGGEIPIRRLHALPWTQFCLRCQEAIEQEVDAKLTGHSFASPLAPAWKRTG
jgi:DnaK suppressor protein